MNALYLWRLSGCQLCVCGFVIDSSNHFRFRSAFLPSDATSAVATLLPLFVTQLTAPHFEPHY